MNRNTNNVRRSRARQPAKSRSAKSMKLNSSLTNRRKEKRALRSAVKAEYLASLPKGRWKRLAARMRPKHLIEYWFSREGAIMALKVIGVFIVLSFFGTIGLFAYYRKDLPALKNISGQNLGGSISYYDRTGKVLLWQDYNAVKRMPVQSNQISPYMKEATVAIEDKSFYSEGAIDIRGIFRAAFHDVLHVGGGLQGGSTITQQLVKLNEGWTDNRTITRKVKELILSIEINREYTKDQILTGYLNMAPYGGIEYGVQAAAEDYFHTNAASLTLAQSAMLAAIPQAPSYYSPYGSTQFNSEADNSFSRGALVGRMDYILALMQQQGYITQAQEDQAKSVDILSQVYPLEGKYQNIQAPYFVMVAKQQLENMYGASTVNRGGWKVITTLNTTLENYAEQDVANNIPNIERARADEEATVLEDVQTGQVEALVGGTNFNNPQYGQINYANINISPGSSIKPFNYVTLINNHNNVGAGSVLYDTQSPIPGYPCTNHNTPLNGGNCAEDYDFRYPGAETIRYALGGSRNVPALKSVMEEIPGDTSPDHVQSVQKFVDTVDAMTGYKDAYKCYMPGVNVETASVNQQTQCYASSGIGDGAYLAIDQQVNGDATMARLGKELPQSFILNITDASGHTVYQWKQPTGTQVVKPDAAYIIDNILSDPRASYLPGYCSATNCTPLSAGGYKFHRYNGWNIAIKTGTTNYNFEGLMTAWTTQYAVVSWVGYHTRNKPLVEGQMEYITEPLTRTLIEQALSTIKTKPINWTQPADIKLIPAFIQRTHVGLGDQEPGPTKELFPSWYTGSGGQSGSQVIDKVSGALATSCTPADAREDVTGANSNNWSVDIFYPPNQTQNSQSKTINTYDTIHQCSDSPPAITLTTPQTCSNLDNSNQGCTITITASQGTHPLGGGSFGGTIDVSIGGQVVKTFNVSSSPASVSFNYIPATSGTVDVTATVTDSVLYQSSQTTQMQDTYVPQPTQPVTPGTTPATPTQGTTTPTTNSTPN